MQQHQKIKMGQVLYQSMTREEEQIQRPHLAPPPKRRAIDYELHLAVAAQSNVIAEKENVSEKNALIPFNANLSEQEVPDFDIMSILDDITEETNKNPVATDKNVVSVTTSNILNNILKSMFSNCTIQNVTFNMPK